MADDTQRSADLLASEIMRKIDDDPAFRETLTSDPVGSSEKLKALADGAKLKADATKAGEVRVTEAEAASTAASADWWVYVIAVAALGFVAVMVVITIYLIASPQVQKLTDELAKTVVAQPDKLSQITIAFAIPDGLIALGSAAIGALAGLLGPLSQRRG